MLFLQLLAVDSTSINRYNLATMKAKIHPKYEKTVVTCNGCGNTFETRSTVDKITVEICSNCHPFYTGKQKLVDVAGRVDRFKAKQAAAQAPTKKSSKAAKPKSEAKDSQEGLKQLKKQLETTKSAPANAEQ